MIKVLDIAKYCIYKSITLNKPITTLELQILLYTLQQKYADKYNEALFYDTIDITSHFPKVNIVYYHFAGYGAMPIEPVTDILNEYKKTQNNLTKECLNIIDVVLAPFLNKTINEKATIYTEQTSVYNKAKANKKHEISPFDF